MQERLEKSSTPKLALRLALFASVSFYCPTGLALEARNSHELSMIAQPVLNHDNLQDGKEMISKMYSQAAALKSYSVDYEMLVYKGSQTIKETGTLAFKKPRLLRVEVQSGPKKGSLAILAADGKVHGHMGGVLRFFSAAVSPDSQLVRTSNDYPMVDTDFLSLIAYLKNMLVQGDRSRATIKPIETDKVSSPTYVVDMIGLNSGHELLLKRIYADAKTLLPVFWEDFIDGKLCTQSSWKNFKANVEFADSTFRP
jgi:outer membrane lipoprotein-sorting protein